MKAVTASPVPLNPFYGLIKNGRVNFMNEPRGCQQGMLTEVAAASLLSLAKCPWAWHSAPQHSVFLWMYPGW